MLRQVRFGAVWTHLLYILMLFVVVATYMELRVLRVGPPPVSSRIPEEVALSCPEPAVVAPEVRVEHRTVQVERTVMADEAEVRKLGKLFATDKVTGAKASNNPARGDVHSYEVIYGMHLAPLRNRTGLKLLEIGLGCKSYQKTVGASVGLWRRLLPKAELWFAEYNAGCVQKQKAGPLKDLNIVVGDQSNPADLKRWIEEAGGDGWDVVIDDGSHKSHHMLATFAAYWSTALKPGGLYFVEDTHVGRKAKFMDPANPVVFSDAVQDWLEQTLTHPKDVAPQVVARNPLPPRMKWMMCQYQACVFHKCLEDEEAHCAPPNPAM